MNIAIVGIGGIARWEHIPALSGIHDVNIVAVCDTNAYKMTVESVTSEGAKAESVKKLLSDPSVKKYTDYQQLLQHTQLDAVHICTPNIFHSVIAEAALKAGVNVFCEKPDAISPEEMQRIVRAAESSKKRFVAMRNNRHLASSIYLKKIIDEGALGKIYSLRCGWQRRRGIPGSGGWFTTKELSGGGVLIDLGVHMLDLADYFLSFPKALSVTGDIFQKFAASAAPADSPHSAFGQKCADGTFDVEDYASAYVRFSDGAALSCEFSWASNIAEETRYVELKGDKGGALWNDGAVTVYHEKHGVLTDETVRCDPSILGHKSAIEEFYNCMREGKDSLYTLSQGAEMIKILSAIYQSAEEKKEIIL